MGIPRFYSWLADQNFNNVLLTSRPSNVSSLSIDINSLFYIAANTAYGLGDDDASKARRELIRTVGFTDVDADFRNTFFTLLSNIITQVGPADTVIIAVDGVVPSSKIQQQRHRRYRNALLRPADQLFDSNVFTPGTDFMISLDAYIEAWIKTNKKNLPTVIYSSHLVPGEGEHKIMDYFRAGTVSGENNPSNGIHVLYGIDADLIMLSLINPLNGIYLARNDVDRVINIDSLKVVIRQLLDTNSLQVKDPNGQAVSDFVTMIFLIGNDFIPHSPTLDYQPLSIKTMIDIYTQIKIPLTNEEGIIWDNMWVFISKLAEKEPELLSTGYVNNKEYFRSGNTVRPFKYPAKLFERSMVIDNNNTRYFRFDIFRELWYQNELLPKNLTLLYSIFGKEKNYDEIVSVDDIEDMCIYYFTGMEWTLLYYRYGMSGVNVDYYYPYLHSPLLTDLAIVAQTAKDKLGNVEVYDGMKIISPLLQLVSVIPPRSISLIPPELRYMYGNDSEVVDLFPSNFLLEVEGVDDESKGLPLIPFAEINRLQVAASKSAFNSYPGAMDKWASKDPIVIEQTEEGKELYNRQRLISEYNQKTPERRSTRGPSTRGTFRGGPSTRGTFRGGVIAGPVRREQSSENVPYNRELPQIRTSTSVNTNVNTNVGTETRPTTTRRTGGSSTRGSSTRGSSTRSSSTRGQPWNSNKVLM